MSCEGFLPNPPLTTEDIESEGKKYWDNFVPMYGALAQSWLDSSSNIRGDSLYSAAVNHEAYAMGWHAAMKHKKEDDS